MSAGGWTRTAQIGLVVLLWTRPAWAQFGFALLAYAAVLLRIFGAFARAGRLPWEPAHLLLAPVHICVSQVAPIPAAALLTCVLHLNLHREGLDRGALLPLLLAGSALWLLEEPVPSLPGLPTHAAWLAPVVWVGVGIAGRAAEEGARLVTLPRGRVLACAALGLPLSALLSPTLFAVLFHPWIYGAVWLGLALPVSRGADGR